MAYLPRGLTKSGIACYMSIIRLIQESESRGIPCYMWTLTFAKTYPDSWCGNMHSRLTKYMSHSVQSGEIPEFAGVRVVEEHPGGHGLHYHWVLRGKVSLAIVRRNAKRAGFGHVFIARDERRRFRKCDAGAAGYLAKYLTKNEKLHGVRAWACIGSYDGSKTKDIEDESQSAKVFRDAYREAISAGSPKHLAFNIAKVRQRQFEHEADIRGIADRPF